jgi:hypothetical protein
VPLWLSSKRIIVSFIFAEHAFFATEVTNAVALEDLQHLLILQMLSPVSKEPPDIISSRHEEVMWTAGMFVDKRGDIVDAFLVGHPYAILNRVVSGDFISRENSLDLFS